MSSSFGDGPHFRGNDEFRDRLDIIYNDSVVNSSHLRNNRALFSFDYKISTPVPSAFPFFSLSPSRDAAKSAFRRSEHDWNVRNHDTSMLLYGRSLGRCACSTFFDVHK